MNKLIPFVKFSKKAKGNSFLSNTSVIVDKKGIPLGFVFGRDSFISFLEHIDEEFDRKVKDPKKAFNNPAGKLIDLIEESLPLNPKFVKELKSSLVRTKRSDWVPFEQITKSLHV
jgi:hypothetical protein